MIKKANRLAAKTIIVIGIIYGVIRVIFSREISLIDKLKIFKII